MMAYLDLHKVHIQDPRYDIGDIAYAIGDSTERQIEDIRCNIVVRPDSSVMITGWQYYLTDPCGGYGPVGENEITTHRPSPKKEVKGTTEVITRAGYVYLVNEVNGVHYKIGRAVDPDDRIRTFNVKLPYKVELEAVIPTMDMIGLEAELHALFADKRVDGEWFALEPADVDYIKSLAVQE